MTPATLKEVMDALCKYFGREMSSAEYFVRWGLIHLNRFGYIRIVEDAADGKDNTDVEPDEAYMPYVYAVALLRLRDVSIEALANNYHACDTTFEEYIPFLEDSIPSMILGQIYIKASKYCGNEDPRIISGLDGDAVKVLFRMVQDDLSRGLDGKEIAMNLPCPKLTKTEEVYDEEAQDSFEKKIDLYTDFAGFCDYADSAELFDAIGFPEYSYEYKQYMEWLHGTNLLWL